VIDPLKPQLVTRGGATGRASDVSTLRLRRASRRARPARVGLFAVSVFGVTLRLDVSWVFGLGLATWTFADAVLPLDVPERTSTAYVTAGGVAALLVLGSLALHEAGHWVVARRVGVPVTQVALSFVGGTLELGMAPRTAASELRIALGGPLASLATAVVAGVVHVVLVELDADPLAASVAAVVGVANLAVVVLNLFPGLPLDGGRILKAAVWGVTGDESRATRLAWAAGSVLAVCLVSLAVVASASGDAAVAIWSGALGLTLLRR